MNQSFPPMSVLRTLKSFRVEVDISGLCLKQPVINLESISKAIDKIVNPSQCTTVVDAILRCRVTIIQVTPEGFAYTVALSVMSPVPGFSASELFIVWTYLTYGSIDALRVGLEVEQAAADVARLLAARLKQ